MSQKQMTYIQEATILHIPKQYIKLKWEKNFIGFFINSLLTKGFFTDFSYIPYTSKHSRGKTFAVHQQYALCRENFRGLQT